jgi:hypothetical protein
LELIVPELTYLIPILLHDEAIQNQTGISVEPDQCEGEGYQPSALYLIV